MWNSSAGMPKNAGEDHHMQDQVKMEPAQDHEMEVMKVRKEKAKKRKNED